MKNIEAIKVSVIIPLYNAQEYMEESVLSVREQTHKNLEIILVNDGSIDNTQVLCEQYSILDSRVKIIQQGNAGPGVARNHGLDVATGEFVCFVDSDDRLAPEAIERMLYSMEYDCDLVQCRSQKVYEDGRVDEEPWGEVDVQMHCLEAMKDYLYSSKPIIRFSVWAKLIRRSTIGDLRFPEMNNTEDVVFNAYLIDRCRKITYIPTILYFVKIREGSLSHTPVTRSKIESSIRCNEMILNLIKSSRQYSFLLGRVYWSSVTTMMANAITIYKQKSDNWRKDIAFLRDKCKELKIPCYLLNIKQKVVICFFKMSPKLFAFIGYRFLK